MAIETELLLGLIALCIIGLFWCGEKLWNLRKLSRLPAHELVSRYEAFTVEYLDYRKNRPRWAEDARKNAETLRAVMEARGIIQ